jgi:GTP-binding protein
VVQLDDDRSFVAADIPGLIEGAHLGHGLGHHFLRHVERTGVLVHLIDVSSGSGRDPIEDFEAIQRELALFRVDVDGTPRAVLTGKPQIVAPSKIDALDDPARLARLAAHARARGYEVRPVSGVTGEGVRELLDAAWRRLVEARSVSQASE